MRFAAVFLFLVAASAQSPCDGNVESNCTAAGNNCRWSPGYCLRNYTGTPGDVCDTSSTTTCPGSECGVGPRVTNSMTCSKCSDTCRTHTDNATCSASGGTCVFTPGRCFQAQPPTPAPVTCYGVKTPGACTAMAYCMWMEVLATSCGETATEVYCTPCVNNTASASMRQIAGIKSKLGQTCTWPSGGNHTSALSVSFKVLTLNAQCDALPDLTGTESDSAAIAYVDNEFGGTRNPDATMTCTATANGNAAGSLLPSLALLALAAALA